MDLSCFLTHLTVKKINSWEEKFNVKVIVSSPSKSRMGVFIPKRHGYHIVRINNNLNKYSFLITLIHELAHASIWGKYGRRVNPHGNEWKDQYRKMMLPFLNPEFFPEDILRLLSNHMINPKATTVRDLELYMILKKYDKNRSTFISEINDGDEFSIDNGKRFVRIEKLRKNYKCKEISTGKLYRFSPIAEVKLI
ncbi:SprT-like domain-containing protein [Flavobacteriales bacterium]|nr:SprT-like domain-containing protein [Flavobacteriales bacterium]